jgi:hypothetical protein
MFRGGEGVSKNEDSARVAGGGHFDCLARVLAREGQQLGLISRTQFDIA